MAALTLLPKLGRRVERGHLWVFSNEVAGKLPAGEADELEILDSRGRFLGMALASTSSLIRARIYSRIRGQACDTAYFRERIAAGKAYRARVLGGALPHSYRLLHADADGVPGLVLDVYGDHAVLQLTTSGMERRRGQILDAIREELAPRVLVERSDAPARRHEELEPRREVVWGEPDRPATVRENGVVLLADLVDGQKTGYFLDLVDARARVRPFLRGRVLDTFSYVGAWTLVALAAGADSVTTVDSSAPALALAREALARSEADAARVSFVQADCFDTLRDLVRGPDRFDTIILDPPPLARSRKDREAALKAYRELNLRAMQLLAVDGTLVTLSCSHAISADDLHEALVMAARDARRDMDVVMRLGAGPDHPIHLQTPETEYLKGYVLAAR